MRMFDDIINVLSIFKKKICRIFFFVKKYIKKSFLQFLCKSTLHIWSHTRTSIIDLDKVRETIPPELKSTLKTRVRF